MTRVLLVDDDSMVRSATRLMLESSGMEVDEAINGTEGVRAFRACPADVVMSDMFMPGKDGLELIRELRREFPEAKIIAMSGGGFNGKIDMLPVARRLGAAAVLYKPFDRSTAVAAIRAVTSPAPKS